MQQIAAWILSRESVWYRIVFVNLFERIFPKKKRICGPVVDLVEEQVMKADAWNQYVPSFIYGIYLHGSLMRVGNCDLRVGQNEELYYAGNIGYHIDPPFRGHHYALEACHILFQLAEQKGMSELIITCSPDNPASQKTLEALSGYYIETTAVPSGHWLYKRGETVKRIYRYTLEDQKN